MKFSKQITAVCCLLLAVYSAYGQKPTSEVIDTPGEVAKPDDLPIDPIEPLPPLVEISPEEDYGLNFTSINNSELLQSLSTADAVDLCFLVDITGSMGPYIEGVKESIREVVDQLTNTTDRDNPLINNLRLSFVGYRDFEDDTQFEILSFTPKVSKFLDFLNKIRATGGGDSPEDVFGGLEKVAEREWTESALRVLFHMADAPCHHPRCGEHTGQDPLNRTAEELFKPFRDQKVTYNFGQISTETQPMIKWFQEAYGEEISVFDLGISSSSYPPGGVGFGGESRGLASVGGLRRPSAKKAVGDAYLGAVLSSISKKGGSSG